MVKYLFCSVLIVFLILSNVYSGDEFASISIVSSSSSYNDFDDVVPSITASAHYHNLVTCGYRVHKWNGSSWTLLSFDHSIYQHYPYGGQNNWSITNEPIEIKDLGQFGNGDYKIVFSIHIGWIGDTDEYEFEVNDVTAPGAPANLSVSAPTLNHPKVSWTHNSELDLKHYIVYKKIDDGGWDPLGTTTDNYYWDTEETVIASTNSTPATAYYRATAVDYTNNVSSYSNTDDIGIEIVGGTPDLKVADISPYKYNVAQNYPNPFNPETNITFGIPQDNFVSLVVYNIQGEKVATLVNEQLATGSYTAKFDASLLPSGIYIYKIQAGSFSQIKRMLLIK